MDIKWEDLTFQYPKGEKEEILPVFETLKEYKKFIQNNIDEYKAKFSAETSEVMLGFYEACIDYWIAKKKKFTKPKFKKDKNDLLTAKNYPIENLLEFKGGFCKCPFHEEKTGSAKLYKQRNKIHCFGCGIDADSIDIKMKLDNITLSEAIKKLIQ